MRLVSGGTISTVAGTGTCDFAGDSGLAKAAQLKSPAGLELGGTGELVVSDQGNHRLRTVLAGSDGIVNGGGDEYILTSAGGATPTPGFCGDPDPNPTPPPEVIAHPATDACLNTPAGLARAGDNLYFSDEGNDRVRKIPADCDLDGLVDSEEKGLLLGDTEKCKADTDEDGYKDPQSTNQAGANLDTNQDNCPIVANPGQENGDSQIGNGMGIAGDDLTAPNSDVLGDACDPDLDNDGIPNASDSDPGGDITYDDNANGNPCVPLGTDGDDDGPSWDSDCNGELDGLEASCPLAVNPGLDDDGDGLQNTWEVCKWGTNPNIVDSDGDTLGDCTEAVDTNGNGIVLGDFGSDALNSARAALLPAGVGAGQFGKDGDFDLNGNNIVAGDFGADTLTTAKMTLGLLSCQ